MRTASLWPVALLLLIKALLIVIPGWGVAHWLCVATAQVSRTAGDKQTQSIFLQGCERRGTASRLTCTTSHTAHKHDKPMCCRKATSNTADSRDERATDRCHGRAVICNAASCEAIGSGGRLCARIAGRQVLIRVHCWPNITTCRVKFGQDSRSAPGYPGGGCACAMLSLVGGPSVALKSCYGAQERYALKFCRACDRIQNLRRRLHLIGWGTTALTFTNDKHLAEQMNLDKRLLSDSP